MADNNNYPNHTEQKYTSSMLLGDDKREHNWTPKY